MADFVRLYLRKFKVYPQRALPPAKMEGLPAARERLDTLMASAPRWLRDPWRICSALLMRVLLSSLARAIGAAQRWGWETRGAIQRARTNAGGIGRQATQRRVVADGDQYAAIFETG